MKFLTLALLLAASSAVAAPIDPIETDLLLDRLIAGTAQYHDAAVGKRLAAGIDAERPRYRQIGDDTALAEALSQDLRRIGNDKHLRVRPGGVPGVPADIDPARRAALETAEEASRGFGLTDIRRLTGNVGYLRLIYFSNERPAVEAIDAAMRLLAPTDALVIDLSQNSGGAHETLSRLLGYFFAAPVQMATLHWLRDGKVVTQTRYSDRAAQPAYLDRPVYVLTGARTFSAAEELAYDLRAEKRATIVGATSRGGANPTERPVELTRGLIALIPNGRAEHPVTHANWEGTGITPDVVTPEADALKSAFLLALAATSAARGKDPLGEERAWAMANPDAAIAGQRWR